jgi:hypothetical protein
MKIIAISGKRQRGKDTAARMLQQMIPGSKVVRWAQVLKKVSAIILGCREEDFESELFKGAKIGGVYGDMTYREFLIKFGTEAGRVVNPLIWIDALERSAGHDDIYIIPDTRFLNEAQYVDSRPGNLLIRIERRGVDESGVPEYVLNSGSECELDKYPFNHVVHNNGSLDDLKETLLYIYIYWAQEEFYRNSPGLN